MGNEMVDALARLGSLSRVIYQLVLPPQSETSTDLYLHGSKEKSRGVQEKDRVTEFLDVYGLLKTV